MQTWIDKKIVDQETKDFIFVNILLEDGKQYFAYNKDCDMSKVPQAIKDRLPPMPGDPSLSESYLESMTPYYRSEMNFWKSRATIDKEIREIILRCIGKKGVAE